MSSHRRCRPSRAGSPPMRSRTCWAPAARRAARCSSPGRPASAATPTAGAGSSTRSPLSRTGTVWSYTDAQYQPPPPYIPPGEEHEPFAIAAVELAEEQMVILGQVAKRLRRRRPVRGRAGGARRRAPLRGRRRRPPHLPLEARADGVQPGVRSAVLRRRGCTSGGSGGGRSTSTASTPRWRPSTTPASAGATCSSSPAARRSATGTPATSPPRRSPRRSAGTAPASPPATPPAPRASPPSTRRGHGSWPGCATSRWSSVPTPRRRGSSRRWRASAGTTRTGCASASSAPPTPPTSRCTPVAAWTSTAPPTPTSPR